MDRHTARPAGIVFGLILFATAFAIVVGIIWPAGASAAERIPDHTPLPPIFDDGLGCDTDPTTSYCAGPSDQGDPDRDPDLEEPRRPRPRTEPFGSIVEVCGPAGAWLDVATSAGIWTLELHDRTEAWEATPDALSSIGLVGHGFHLDETGPATLTGTHAGKVYTLTVEISDPCPADGAEVGPATVVEASTSSQRGGELPETGTDAALLALLGAILTAGGVALVRSSR